MAELAQRAHLSTVRPEVARLASTDTGTGHSIAWSSAVSGALPVTLEAVVSILARPAAVFTCVTFRTPQAGAVLGGTGVAVVGTGVLTPEAVSAMLAKLAVASVFVTGPIAQRGASSAARLPVHAWDTAMALTL